MRSNGNQEKSAQGMIIHLSRRDGTPLFLHPFLRRGSTLEVSPTATFAGCYGEEPRVESLTILRNELYRRIDEDVRDWINERRFIPRFLIASGAFLVVFLFLALVVHTPIPLVDELLGAGAAGIVVFIFVGRRFESSRAAGNRRVALRTRVDSAVFSEEQFVRQLEAILRRLEQQQDLFAPVSATPEARELWRQHREPTAQVIAYLRDLLHTPQYRKLSKEMKRGSLSSKTEQAVETADVIPALILLLRELTASAE
jgi:hypothetical protein